MPGIDDYAKSLRQDSGQRLEHTKTNLSAMKNLYPAIVVDEADPTEQGRLVARIVSLDEVGEVNGGRDRNISDGKLQFAVPLMPGFIHMRPLPGEMVFLLMENPSDITAPRYWIGPVLTSQLKLRYQTYRDALRVFDKTSFNLNQQLLSRSEPSLGLPERSDVALQGRDDTHIILRPKEIFIAAGLFRPDTLKANLEHPSFLRMKQIVNTDEKAELKRYSMAEMTSTVVNIYSPRGKFRENSLEQFEDNKELKELGELANKLHPTVFGDELVKLLDLMIRIILTHVHTPQAPLAPNPNSKQLSNYTVTGELQRLLSKHVRVN
jgi:hypothetical protein